MIWIRLYQFLSPLLFTLLKIGAPILPFFKRARLVRTKNPTPHIPDKTFIQFHCASLGEYEMALPLIQHYAQQQPVLISFYSPSGFDHAQIPHDTPFEIVSCYLPLDLESHYESFYSRLNVSKVVVMKYEIWPNWLQFLTQKNIPVILANGYLPNNHWLFKPLAFGAYRILNRFSLIIVQDEAMKRALQAKITVPVDYAPDLRYERVKSVTDEVDKLPKLDEFKGSRPLLVLGSSWEDEERLLSKVLDKLPEVQVVIAPHDISPAHIKSIKKHFASFVAQTWDKPLKKNQRILIVDRIGLLKSIYSYSDVSIVGGAFGKGLHNILESLAFGAPVLFGPNYSDFPEAHEAIKRHAGYTFINEFELQSRLEWLLTDPSCLEVRKYYSLEMIKAFQGSVDKHIELIDSD
jgi:3-deoxy-D-manno-octulosonic-acid transferase